MLPTNVLVDWKRSTSYVLDSRAPGATMAASRQPPRASCIQVRATGTPSGTVTVSGTVNGVADSEVLTFSGVAGVKATTKQFTTVAFTSSLTGATVVEATAVGRDGAPQATTWKIRESWPVHLASPGTGQKWPGTIPGHERTSDRIVRVPYEETWTPREGDVVVVVQPPTGETFQVFGTPTTQGNGLAVDHWQVKLSQQQGS